jgi:hypothetical protein
MKIVPIGEDFANPDGMAVFFEVDNDTLKDISNDRNWYLDQAFVKKCELQKGNNAHFFLLVNTGSAKDVIATIRRLLVKYETVSWWTVEHTKFYLRRQHGSHKI